MKNTIIIILLIICHEVLEAQKKLNRLEAPTSPASNILGIQPSSVLSPKSYQALETSLFSSFFNSSNEVIIPNDFALEFTPYWTKNHGLSLNEYLYPKSAFDQFIRNFSVSLASTQNFVLGDSSATNGLAFGFRTTFYFSNSNDRKKVTDYKEKLKTQQSVTSYIVSKLESLVVNTNIDNSDEWLKNIKSILIRVMQERGSFKNIEEVEEMANKIYDEASLLPPFESTQPEPFLDSLYVIIDDNLNAQALFNEFKEYIKERQGFSVDIAYANLINFPTNNFEFSYLPRQSFWITPSYRFKDQLSMLKVMGVLRYEWYNIDYFKLYFLDSKIYRNNFDYGLALSTLFWKFSLQFEMVGRYSSTEIPAGTDAQGNELYRKEENSYIESLMSQIKQ